MDARHAYQMGAPLGVEVVQIGHMLEVVGVLVSVLHGGVGHHVVGVFIHHQLNALLFQDVHALLENLGVGGGGGGHAELHGLGGAGRSGILGGGIGGIGGSLGVRRSGAAGILAAAGGQGQGQNQGQGESENLLFHTVFLQFKNNGLFRMIFGMGGFPPSGLRPLCAREGVGGERGNALISNACRCAPTGG